MGRAQRKDRQGTEAWAEQGLHPERAVVTGRKVTEERGPVLFTLRSSEPLWQSGTYQVLPSPVASFSSAPRPLSPATRTPAQDGAQAFP